MIKPEIKELEDEARAAYLRLIPEARVTIGQQSYVRAYVQTFLDDIGGLADSRIEEYQ